MQLFFYNTCMQILEAVPNVSNGTDPQLLATLVQAVKHASNVRVLHTDANADANRTVLTLAGSPNEIINACFALIQTAAHLIDMRFQHGAHPRLGATDVCPLVPVKNISLAETAAFADQLARRVANELQIPVYLYEGNARTPARKNLSFIRRGEYESLPEKLKNFPPDYGPTEWSEPIAKTGATVIGARPFLIAFNMSLNTPDVLIAKKTAAQLREANGGLPAVKAIGWYMADYHCAQVSCNLTDFHQTNLAVLFEACKQAAVRYGLSVTAGELIGLIPQEALLSAGRFYAPHTQHEAALIRAAVENLKLNILRPFDPNARILERQLKF